MARGVSFVAALSLVVGALAARAQDGPPPGRPGGPGPDGPRPRPPLVTALDANQDGTIDKSEIADASAALQRLDRDGDGRLTPEETRPSRPDGRPPGGGPEGGGPPGGGGPGGRPRPPIEGALDADQDGTLDAREISNASAALKALDKNQDGSLARDEIHPRRPGDPDRPPPR